MIVTGDLNEPPGGAVARALEDAGFVDVWRATQSDAGFSFPATGPLVRIDYAWLRSGASAFGASSAMVGAFGSDHLGLVVEVRR
jgi:endonuclease/exonuclease/phosphatase (EEP) superfamily protein YafD